MFQPKVEPIQLSFYGNETLNLKTEEVSGNSFFTNHSDVFEQRITYFDGKADQSDPFDYYLVSKPELLKYSQFDQVIEQAQKKPYYTIESDYGGRADVEIKGSLGDSQARKQRKYKVQLDSTIQSAIALQKTTFLEQIKIYMIKRPISRKPSKAEVRHLPPLLKENEFYATISDFLPTVIYKYYVNGKLKEKEKVDSRAYLYFSTEAQMLDFLQNYRKVFCDEKGNYYQPIVRKSMFQNDIPQATKSALGKYEELPFYVDFMQQKDEITQIELPANQEDQSDEKKKFEKFKTPLVMSLEKEYLQEQKFKQQMEGMQQSNIIQMKIMEKDKEVTRMFIFVPKARE